MRLTTRLTEIATRELVELVHRNPGDRTSDLSGTKRFHGEHTLRLPTIIRLLRAAGLTPKREGVGARTWFTWDTGCERCESPAGRRSPHNWIAPGELQTEALAETLSAVSRGARWREPAK